MWDSKAVYADWLENIDGGMGRADADERAYEDFRDLGWSRDEALNEMETF